MDTQTFKLNLFDTTRDISLGVGMILGICASMGLSLWVGKSLAPGQLAALAWLGTLAAGCYLVFRVYKQAVVVPAVVTVSPAELRVEDLRPTPRLSQTVQLADVSSYRHTFYGNLTVLCLYQTNASKLKLQTAGWQTSASTFNVMCAAIEQALETADQSGNASRRAKNFFEKPVSTYLLLGFTTLVVVELSCIGSDGRPRAGAVVGMLTSYFTYSLAWPATIPRRNAA